MNKAVCVAAAPPGLSMAKGRNTETYGANLAVTNADTSVAVSDWRPTMTETGEPLLDRPTAGIEARVDNVKRMGPERWAQYAGYVRELLDDLLSDVLQYREERDDYQVRLRESNAEVARRNGELLKLAERNGALLEALKAAKSKLHRREYENGREAYVEGALDILDATIANAEGKDGYCGCYTVDGEQQLWCAHHVSGLRETINARDASIARYSTDLREARKKRDKLEADRDKWLDAAEWWERRAKARAERIVAFRKQRDEWKAKAERDSAMGRDADKEVQRLREDVAAWKAKAERLLEAHQSWWDGWREHVKSYHPGYVGVFPPKLVPLSERWENNAGEVQE